MTSNNIVFQCGTLKLEGIFHAPAGKTKCPAVVVCHPHPVYGGSMHNNVTYAIADGLSMNDICALLFNFRGVEGSEGQHGGGIAEQDDVKAALDWLEEQPEVDKARLGLVGYSFGAYVSLPVACSDGRVKGAAFISPFLDAGHLDIIKKCTIPRILIAGTRDSLINPQIVQSYQSLNPAQSSLLLIDGADHFWAGHEKEMSAAVTDFFNNLFRF